MIISKFLSKKLKSKINSQIKKSVVIVTALAVVALLIPSLGFAYPTPKSILERFHLGSPPTLDAYAKQVMNFCAASSFTPSCYDEQIPKLMDQGVSMEDAFGIAKIVQKSDPSYIYCHVLGHNISYRETTKHPEQWKDIIARCPTTTCNNGCPHGVMLKKFNADYLTPEQIDKILPDITTICEPRGSWNPVRIEVSMCYHAIGHLLMYQTRTDIKRSVQLCEAVGKKSDGRDYTHICTQGVFMQVFQPLEPEDYALVKGLTPTRDTVEDFCRPYSGQAFNACWTESWVLKRMELYTPSESTKFCNRLSGDDSIRECYAGLMSFITVDLIMTSEDYPQLKSYCGQLPSPSNCFVEAARRLMQIDPELVNRALHVCNDAASSGVGWDCYRALANYSRMSFHPGTSAFNDYCQKLPQDWQPACVKGESNVPLPEKSS